MQQFQDPDNQPKFTHELIAGAAAYYAAGKYEEHCEANGKTFPLFLSGKNTIHILATLVLRAQQLHLSPQTLIHS